jgi:exodeoxyribonuclease-3
VRGKEKPSDHAPVSVDLDWPPSDDDDNDDGDNENGDLLF